MKPTARLDRNLIMRTPNVATLLSKEQADAIFAEATDGYRRDKSSRADWEKRYAQAMNLAMQVREHKTFPWEGCANVKFPLVTVAALQYQAKAYPALIDGRSVYQGYVEGKDETGQLTEVAERVGLHMSWQCLQQDMGWEEDSDKLLLVQAIVGCVFRKRWFDPVKRYQRSKVVVPADLVTNYYTKSLAESSRYTHKFYLTRNNIVERIQSGMYTKMDIQEMPPAATGENSEDETTEAEDERQGVTAGETDHVTPYLIGEQFCWFDLDGDGYEEPYIVTFDLNTKQGWRIAARYNPSGVTLNNDDKVISIKAIEFFTKYSFIPSPDNGFYDMGLGSLAGPLNDSVDAAINQIFDAGTMATLGGGFVGRGFKSKGGPFSFRPHMWVPTDSPGDDLRKNILPLPVREPSNVLFQLIGFLVQYAERIVSATDIQVGESPGQNMKAGTAEILNQNGAHVYTAIYKRTWRAIRDEGQILYDSNRIYLDQDVDFRDLTSGLGITIYPKDYSLSKVVIVPAADPHIVSDSERRDQASMLVKNAFTMPGHNRYNAMKRMYKALKIPNINEILEPPTQPGPDGQPQPAKDYPQPPNPKMLEVQVKQKAQELKEKEFQSGMMEQKIKLQGYVQKNQAEVVKLYEEAKKIQAETADVGNDHIVKLIYAKIEALNSANDSVMKMIDFVASQMPMGGGEPEGIPPGAQQGPGATGQPPSAMQPAQGNGAMGMLQ